MAQKSKSKKSNAAKAAEILKHKKALLQPSATLVATAAMKAAIEACEAKVDAIVKECLENNCKFRDQKFEILMDRDDCLYSSLKKGEEYWGIAGSKRVPELFKNPVFFLDGAKPEDIKQGYIGDCWFLAALAVVSNIPGLLEKLCVKRNEEIGVYGFIFFKDGDWVSTVVDDQLFYAIDYRSYKNSLYFGSCKEERETWLPLMEKAYAKIHGDYKTIEGGHTAEGIEDLTGGVTSVILTHDILDKNRLWEEMQNVNKTLLIGCSINIVDGDGVGKHGIQSGHAYSVLSVAEIGNERLVQIRNPWGCVEWNGDWSDDSDRWTPEIRKALGHKKDDDGQFWMSYKDFLRVFTAIDKCRIFDSTWSVASSWIPYHVAPRSSGKFELEITKASETVVVLTLPDVRYQGATVVEYEYYPTFHIYDSDNKMVKRWRPQPSYLNRSVSCEIKQLKPGKYTIVPHLRREQIDIKDEKAEAEKKPDETEQEKKEKLLFQQRKTRNIQNASLARQQGRHLVGVDDEDYHEVKVETEGDKWEITLGVRVYTHDPNVRLEGLPGEHPDKKDKDKDKTKAKDDKTTAEPDDPEAVTSTLADKKDKAEKKTDKDEKTPEKKGDEETKDEKAKDEKAKDEKAKDEKAEDEKAKDEKARDEKARDEKTEEEKTKVEKTEDEKAKDEKIASEEREP